MVIRKSFTALTSLCHAALMSGLRHRQGWNVMKQRNFVAKYSQRSGAGKHKEKPMREYNYDDWNDIDADTIDYSALEQSEERIAELNQTIEDMKTDELYILYHMMNARTKTSLEAVFKDLDFLIKLHSKELIEKAKNYKPQEF
jgi:hypothetical protein